MSRVHQVSRDTTALIAAWQEGRDEDMALILSEYYEDLSARGVVLTMILLGHLTATIRMLCEATGRSEDEWVKQLALVAAKVEGESEEG